MICNDHDGDNFINNLGPVSLLEMMMMMVMMMMMMMMMLLMMMMIIFKRICQKTVEKRSSLEG